MVGEKEGLIKRKGFTLEQNPKKPHHRENSQKKARKEMSSYSSSIINDPVHGLMNMPKYCMEIIDTPQFQRLRDLKQLGCTYYVFPGASHNRFEHSLGVAHLTLTWLSRFKQEQPELELSDRDLRLVTVAGLCHGITVKKCLMF